MKLPHHLTRISDLKPAEILRTLHLSSLVKKDRQQFKNDLRGQTLLMLFEKPSLRTRVSFEVGMTELGGHAIYYNIADSPLGKKESIEDTAKVLSRMVQAIMARVNSRKSIQALALNATVPVINGLDDYAHPCQILADLLTIQEKRKIFGGMKMAYFGDTRNNMTYDLMRAACSMGFQINVCGPSISPKYDIEGVVLKECESLSREHGGSFQLLHDPKEAANGVDVVYTDSWMSYGIPEEEKEHRKKELLPYQVNSKLMSYAKKDAIFMNCLPAIRGMEQTAEVIDGPQSVVFDQAENRLHVQKALLLLLLKPEHFQVF